MDLSQYLLAFVALVFVVCLMLGLSWVLRRMGISGITPIAGDRNLGIIEQHPLDRNRKLVLIRRGDKAHLLLLSHGKDTVIESDIPVEETQTRVAATLLSVKDAKEKGEEAA